MKLVNNRDFMNTAFTRTFLLVLLIAVFAISQKAQGQDDDSGYYDDSYEELYVLLTIENIGYYEIDALYSQDQLYLPVVDMFSKLKIYVTHSMELDTVVGYLGNEENIFNLNTDSREFTFLDKTIQVSEDQYIATYNDLFLPLSIYEKLFGFSLKFDFRTLAVHLSSDIELPVVKLLRIERMRENMKALTGEVKVDTTVLRKYHLLSGAVFDWNLSMKQGSGIRPSYNLKVAAGAELLGGELNINAHLGNREDFKLREQAASWRFIRNQSPIVKQIELGIITAPLFSQANSSLLGLRLTNTPKAYRKSFGVYVLQKKSLPGWEVELYINDVLVDFATADANGEFTFEVPLIYGSSTVILKHYGPWGEEKIEEQIINIPFIFVPKNKAEYQVYSGITVDTAAYKFAQARISYGLGRRATISAGYEIFERNISSRHMPFVNGSAILFKNMMVSYSCVLNAYQKGSFLIRTKGNLSFEGDYKYFFKDQDAVTNSNRSETLLGLNLPFKVKKTGGYLKSYYRINQTIAGNAHYLENNFAVFYKRLNIGLISNISIWNTRTSTFGVNISLSLARQWTLYAYSFSDLKANELKNLRFQVQKKFGRYVFSNFSWNFSVPDRVSAFSLNVYFDLKVFRSSIEGIYSDKSFQAYQSFSGSAVFSNSRKPVASYSYTNQGKGILDVIVFLDVNHNNIKDKNEPLIKEASVSISKGLKVSTEKDSITRFISLEPYTQYILTLDKSGIQSISWIPAYTLLAVYPDPNQVKKVYFPVHPMGEIEGRVMVKSSTDELQALARIVIEIRNSKNEVVAKTLTEYDGYFYYLGLKPGTYQVSPDPDQLKNLGFEKDTSDIEVKIRQSDEGDFINGLDIILEKRKSGSK